MKSQNEQMLHGPLLKNILLYTLPIIATSILQLFFNAADLIVVGQYCGSISVGAVGATSAITNLIVNLFVGLSVGAGVAVAHGLGAREDEVVRRTVHTAIPTALLSGVILTFIGVVFSRDLLALMDTPKDVLPLSTVYMQIYFGGITFSMVYNFCASILRAAGDTRSPLIFLSFAGVVNVILNLIFVRVFHMNVAGVALATTISQGISAVLVTLTLMRRTDACRLVLKQMHIHREQLTKMLRIGLPAGIQGSLFSISNVMIQSSINAFGEALMSGNAAAGNIEGFVYTSMNAFHQTSVNFTGQNVGAGQYNRVKQVFWTCLGCVTVTGLAMGAACYLAGPTLLSIYITDSTQAITYGMLKMAYVTLPYFLCGMMEVSTGVLRGMGASTVPMVISVLGICGFRIGWICTIFQLPQFHNPTWLYLSYPISWILTFAAQLIAFLMVYKKQTKALDGT